MIETKEKVLDGKTFMVTQLPARRALKLQGKLIKTFGTTVTQFMLLDKEEEDEKKEVDGQAGKKMSPVDQATVDEIKKNSVVKMMQLLASSIQPETFEQLASEVLIGVRMDGVELNDAIIDREFAGKLCLLYQVIWFVLEVNFGDFFGQGGIGTHLSNLNPPDLNTKKTYTYR